MMRRRVRGGWAARAGSDGARRPRRLESEGRVRSDASEREHARTRPTVAGDSDVAPSAGSIAHPLRPSDTMKMALLADEYAALLDAPPPAQVLDAVQVRQAWLRAAAELEEVVAPLRDELATGDSAFTFAGPLGPDAALVLFVEALGALRATVESDSRRGECAVEQGIWEHARDLYAWVTALARTVQGRATWPPPHAPALQDFRPRDAFERMREAVASAVRAGALSLRAVGALDAAWPAMLSLRLYAREG